jgi:hypothetical protein
MQSQTLMLRCYAEQESKCIWVAVCIDLCLAAQGESCGEAQRLLNSQIDCYVFDAVFGEDQKYADQLLNRKAPLKQRFKYHLIRLHLSSLLFRHKMCDFIHLAPHAA